MGNNITIKDDVLRKAAGEGMDSFLEAMAQAIKEGVGGELSAETMPKLNADQITLLGYLALRDEVMDGGFVQLIHNGLGGFIFCNPFDKAMAQWGLTDLSRLIKKAHKLYNKYHRKIEKEYSDEEFMALFEQMPEFDDCDDEFVEHEEQWTAMAAYYVDEKMESFVTVI